MHCVGEQYLIYGRSYGYLLDENAQAPKVYNSSILIPQPSRKSHDCPWLTGPFDAPLNEVSPICWFELPGRLAMEKNANYHTAEQSTTMTKKPRVQSGMKF